MSTNNPKPAAPRAPKPIAHPCLNCGKEERTEVAGILGKKCQAQVRKTWGSKPDRQTTAALREDRLTNLYRHHLAGKRGPVRYGSNGGVR